MDDLSSSSVVMKLNTIIISNKRNIISCQSLFGLCPYDQWKLPWYKLQNVKTSPLTLSLP